jgi:energy-coupling factor transporter ATP-binding protein EcfA2
MNKLYIKLENCFGIKSFEHEFSFNVSKKTRTNTALIYASNGTMKTSFAKTLDLIAKNDPKNRPKDRLYEDKISAYEVKADDVTLPPERIFVVNGENIEFDATEKISNFLASSKLKVAYDEILSELDYVKSNFIRELKKLSKSSDCEQEIKGTFKNNSLYSILVDCNRSLQEEDHQTYSFRYNYVFDKKGKVREFIKKNRSLLQDYITQYNSLLSESSFFKSSENSFGTYQAKQLIKSIADDSFFSAGHTLLLDNDVKVQSAAQLKEIVREELNKILSDENLKKKFEKIDKALDGNSELRALKAVLEKNNLLIPKLMDYDSFRQEVWMGFLYQLSTEVNSIVELFLSKKEELEEIIAEAKKERALWEKIVQTFNGRFHVPFRVKLTNQADVLLKRESAQLEFIFKNGFDKPILSAKEDIVKVLSKGEQRAFHILQILFEIESRKKSGETHLIVFDDIADSFDYKNKYAIIEYIRDLDAEGCFKQIILTHNFDFFRTINKRIVSRKNSFIALRNDGVVTLFDMNTKGCDIRNNPFIIWKKELNNDTFFVASIPFVRNLIEYKGGQEKLNYKLLTSLLHIKNDTRSILIRDLKPIYEETIGEVAFPEYQQEKKVVDIIFSVCDQLCNSSNELMRLADKICLSMGIRLLAELYMIHKIENLPNLSKGMQTGNLLKKFRDDFENIATEKDNLYSCIQVSLMTPENIHINSFMFEPILDMSILSLKKLYLKFKDTTSRVPNIEDSVYKRIAKT